MKHIAEFIGPLLIRFTSLMIMGYSILYLLVTGGAASVGALSGVFAITAPVIMFLLFRYVESLSISDDRARDFTLHCLIAIGGYCISAPAIWVVISMLGIDPLVAGLLLAFKPFEILSDLLVTMFVSTGRGRHGQISSLLRLLGVVIISLLSWRLWGVDPLIAVSFALLVAYGTVSLFFDLPRALSAGFFSRVSIKEGHEFFRDNVKFGIFGLVNSAGSSLPRLMVGFAGGLASLGIFSVLYQVSATAVNVVQYPISLHAVRIAAFVRRSRALSWLVSGVALSAAGLATVALFGAVPAIDGGLTKNAIGLCSLLTLLMLVALLLRGVLVSAVIALNRAHAIQLIAVVALGVGVLFTLPIAMFAEASFQMYGAVAFVLISCAATAGLLLSRVRSWN